MRVLVAMAALLALPMVVHADDAAVQREIQSMYDRMAEGIKKKDLSPVMSVLTPDFTNVGMGQKGDRKSFEAQMREHMASTKNVEVASFKIKKLSVKGTKAVADVHSKLKLTAVDAKGEMGPKGATHKLDMVMTDRETWVNGGSGWKLKHSESIAVKMLMDGKPMDMGAPPPPKKK